ERAADGLHRPPVDGVLAFVVRVVSARVVQVELRLGPAVEALDEPFQPGLAGHHDDLLVHQLPPFARRDLRRSGVTLSSPIFWAFSASSRKARAIMVRGSPPPAARAVSIRQSMPRTGLSVASRA